MDATTPLSSDAQRKQDRSRKRKAILAGGVVLGLGAAATLAAWSDDVFANGTFATGTFNLEGNVYGTDEFEGWKEYNTIPGGTLQFQVPVANMAPGDVVYAPFSIRTSTATTTAADVTVTSPTGPGTDGDAEIFEALTLEVIETSTENNCDAETTGTSKATGGLNVEIPEFELQESGDPARHFCFKVSLPSTLTPAELMALGIDSMDDLQGMTTGQLVWQFNGESTV